MKVQGKLTENKILHFVFKLDVYAQQKHINQLLACPKTYMQDWTAFFTPSFSSLSFLSILLPPPHPTPPLFFLNGTKVAMAGVQDHRAWDHTDGER